jgi:hypothetical protein
MRAWHTYGLRLFRGVFTLPQWKYFVTVLVGLVPCDERRTLSALLPPSLIRYPCAVQPLRPCRAQEDQMSRESIIDTSRPNAGRIYDYLLLRNRTLISVSSTQSNASPPLSMSFA